MVMDVAKTHNSTPPPGGGWVDAAEDEGSGSRRVDGAGTCKSHSRKRTTTTSEDLVPPDGGWGWIIVLGNCINSAVLNSVVPCYGVMYLPLVALGYSNTQVASIPSIFVGFTNILGPVATGLSHYYSARSITLTGISITVLGILLCSFYKNIIWFYLCFGVIAGIGNALASPQGFLLGQKYFCHKRATANGLSTVGASLGGMVFPPLVNYMVETYSVDGAFMLWAGLLLHGLIGGSLFHPVSWHLMPKRTASLDTAGIQQNGGQPKSDIPGNKIVVAGKDEERKEYNVFEDESAVKSLTPDNDSDDSDHEELIMTQDVLLDPQSQKKDICANNCSERQWKNPLTDVLQTNEYLERPRTVSIERSMEILPQIPEESEDEDCFETYDPESGNERIEFLNRENEMRNRPISYISTKSVDSIAKIPSVESIFDSCDVLDQFGSALSFKVEKLKDSAKVSAMEKRKNRSNSVGQHPLRPYILCGLKMPRLQYLINFSILRHPIFVIAAFSSICNRLVYVSVLTYLPSYGNEMGVGRRSAYLLTIVATFELLGKVIMSVVSDQGWVQRRYIHILSSISAGLSVLLLTLAWDIVTLGLCCGLYGFCVGTCISIGPVLLVEYLGLKLLPHSFGLMLFMNGISGFAVLPFTGWLNDVTGNFTSTFYVIGCLNLLPGFLWSLVPCFPKAAGESSKADNV
ncbi:uncharacterized protein LOC135102089 [Scylla paramamosain]|uniref:uncharacterized protein LOC135102089 n=1 Tax=Scylla paramamosain TaxID=85552 RepID=UPI0030836588